MAVTWQYLLDNFKHQDFGNIKLVEYLQENVLPLTKDGITLFNSIIDFLHENHFNNLGIINKQEKFVMSYNKTVRVDVNNVSLPSYYIEDSYNSGIKLVIISFQMFKFIIKTDIKRNKDNITGSQSFRLFNKKCKDLGINLEDYMLADGKGLDVKKTIESQLICFDESIKDQTLENVHHLDFHSAFMSGLVSTHKEFHDAVDYFYQRRKDKRYEKKYKCVLTHTWGYFQSYRCGYKQGTHYALAQLSKDGIEWLNKMLLQTKENLEKTGRKWLSFNTDGIWYQGELYHDENEGTQLGQWANDHINCKFRINSKGKYEFLEEGKYTPVVRGTCQLDEQLSRDDWTWGAIYQTGYLYTYVFDEETQKLTLSGFNEETGEIIKII